LPPDFTSSDLHIADQAEETSIDHASQKSAASLKTNVTPQWVLNRNGDDAPVVTVGRAILPAAAFPAAKAG